MRQFHRDPHAYVSLELQPEPQVLKSQNLWIQGQTMGSRRQYLTSPRTV